MIQQAQSHPHSLWTTLFGGRIPASAVDALRVVEPLQDKVDAAGLQISPVYTTEELWLCILPLAFYLIEQQRGRPRLLVGITGAGGSGKSVLGQFLTRVINAISKAKEYCVCVGVDGYHRTNDWLVKNDLRQLKGRPETFDVAMLHQDLLNLKTRPEVEHRLPAYSRQLHNPVPGAISVAALPAGGIVIVEGILLLLDTPSFRGLGALLDVSLFIDLPEHLTKARINARKEAGGVSHAVVEAHYLRVDQPNFREMLQSADRASLILHGGEQSFAYHAVTVRGSSSSSPRAKL